jgi:SPX domain protein involved in polyphosphate accumulation
MKFAHNLPRNQVPEWASSYINYKGLKKLIKNAAEASKNGSDPDLAGELYQIRDAYTTAIQARVEVSVSSSLTSS